MISSMKARTLEHQIGVFWSNVIKSDGCWNYKKIDGKPPKKGYGYISFNGRKWPANRFSWMIHNGPIPDNLLVCHRCDNPACVRVDHLFLGTVKDNAQDKIIKGRSGVRSGFESKLTKITFEDAVNVVRLAASGVRQFKIAQRFSITSSLVSRILNGQFAPEAIASVPGAYEQIRQWKSIHRRGENSGTAKLTWDKVRKIRSLFATGKYTRISIGRRFGISPQSMTCILSGRYWKEITPPSVDTQSQSECPILHTETKTLASRV